AAGAVTGFTAHMGTTSSGYHIYVRLDSTTGPTIANLVTTSTGGFSTYQDESTAVTGASGVHDLFLVFSDWGTANLTSFQFTNGQPTAPPTPTSLTAAPQPGGAVQLTWAAPAGAATAWQVERSADGVTFALAASPAGTATGFLDFPPAGGNWVYR